MAKLLSERCCQLNRIAIETELDDVGIEFKLKEMSAAFAKTRHSERSCWRAMDSGSRATEAFSCCNLFFNKFERSNRERSSSCKILNLFSMPTFKQKYFQYNNINWE